MFDEESAKEYQEKMDEIIDDYIEYKTGLIKKYIKDGKELIKGGDSEVCIKHKTESADEGVEAILHEIDQKLSYYANYFDVEIEENQNSCNELRYIYNISLNRSWREIFVLIMRIAMVPFLSENSLFYRGSSIKQKLEYFKNPIVELRFDIDGEKWSHQALVVENVLEIFKYYIKSKEIEFLPPTNANDFNNIYIEKFSDTNLSGNDEIVTVSIRDHSHLSSYTMFNFHLNLLTNINLVISDDDYPFKPGKKELSIEMINNIAKINEFRRYIRKAENVDNKKVLAAFKEVFGNFTIDMNSNRLILPKIMIQKYLERYLKRFRYIYQDMKGTQKDNLMIELGSKKDISFSLIEDAIEMNAKDAQFRYTRKSIPVMINPIIDSETIKKLDDLILMKSNSSKQSVRETDFKPKDFEISINYPDRYLYVRNKIDNSKKRYTFVEFGFLDKRNEKELKLYIIVKIFINKPTKVMNGMRKYIDHANACLRNKLGVKKGQFIKFYQKGRSGPDRFEMIADIKTIDSDIRKGELHTFENDTEFTEDDQE
ncbi:MAG: hypothetical protein K9N06_11750 [Candidatus Cloacimonetes bacterium]|nr:hypothetical protein [Candidatus Cloacimonadota bacterium]